MSEPSKPVRASDILSKPVHASDILSKPVPAGDILSQPVRASDIYKDLIDKHQTDLKLVDGQLYYLGEYICHLCESSDRFYVIVECIDHTVNYGVISTRMSDIDVANNNKLIWYDIKKGEEEDMMFAKRVRRHLNPPPPDMS